MKKDVVPIECVARRISYLRGQKVILDRDLALETNRELAQRSSNVETRVGRLRAEGHERGLIPARADHSGDATEAECLVSNVL
jgi:hypothetical protein